ncbi:MAG: DUF438 domain-containing protein [Marinilabiliaceae bacterium]|nr:DUF438 domain-containing protein [Marinilabiliaceae bacterium]
MSEFTNTQEQRINKLLELSLLIIETGNAQQFIANNKDFIQLVIPTDFIVLFDELIKKGVTIEKLKPLSNKILNIFHIPIEAYNRLEPETDSFLWVLEKNNYEMELILNKIKPVFKLFVKDIFNNQIKTELTSLFKKLNLFSNHYSIIENVLFPKIEKTWPDYRCIQLMWSFHDDIKRNIKLVINQLDNEISDMKKFNRLVGDIFFNMLNIKFREEKILFPYIISTIDKTTLNNMNNEGLEIGFPFVKPTRINSVHMSDKSNEGLINIGTGVLSIEQIRLIFNHLPVDITYVDENNQVQFFSTPKKRIFHRTIAIIGRQVNNCHPPESVHVVEKIIQSFKNGEKEKADFWIKMKNEYILIQYFAVRDEKGTYKGIIEVTQEISAIKALEGEKRLLNW